MRKVLRLLPLFALVLSACGEKEEPFVPAKPGALKAGAAVRLLDLPVGISHAGYTQSIGMAFPSDEEGSPYNDIFPSTRGVQSPPTGRVVLLDNGHDFVVLARLDAIYTTFEITERVQQLAKSELDMDLTGRLLLNATHTHGAGCRFGRESVEGELVAHMKEEARHAWAHGGDTYSQEMTDRVARALVEALREAKANLRPARFGWGTGANDSASRDRRCQNDWIYGESYFDNTVTVVRVDDDATGAPIAVMFNYAMHGTINGETNRMLSVDGPGHTEFMTEELFDTPVVAVFLQGAAGDVSPSGHGHDGVQRMQRVGWDLAKTVKEVWSSIETRREVVLQSAERWSPLSHSLLGYGDDEFLIDGGVLCVVPNAVSCPPGPGGPGTGDTVICPGAAVPGRGKYATRFAAARIDGLAMLTLPGEPMSGLGDKVKDQAKALGFEHAMILGYAQDHNGYILEEDDWLSGGYEPTITFWGWKFGPYAIEQTVDVLRELTTGKAQAKHAVEKMPNLLPDAYTPIEPTASDPAPAVLTDVSDTIERLEEIRFEFHGGDPAYGQPDVVLQRLEEGDFADVFTDGWRPVSSRFSYELPLIYEATPNYKSAPDATSRAHRWEAIYEPPVDLPVGTYRLLARGKAKVGAAATDYEVPSRAFELVPSTQLRVDGRAVVHGDKLVVDATVLYPAQQPARAPSPSAGWQIGNFRMLNPEYPAPFVPVTAGAALAGAEVTRAGGSEASFDLSFVARPPERRPFAPGAGPGFRTEIDLAGAGSYTVRIPAGAVGDAHGNVTGTAFTATVEAQ